MTTTPPQIGADPVVPGRWWRIAVAALTIAGVAGSLAMLAAAAEAVPSGWTVFALAPVAALVLGALWLALLIVGLARYRAWGPLVPVAATVLVAAVLVVSGLPAAANLRIPRGALESVAADCTADAAPGWIGGVHVDRIRRGDDGTCYLTTGGFIDETGWVYAPGEAAGTPDAGVTLDHRTGPWRRFTWDF